MKYVLPTAPNVCSYTTLAKMNCHIFTCLTTDTGYISFISTKLFSVLKPNFDIFAEIHQKKMLYTCCKIAVCHHTHFWVPLPHNKPRNWCNKGTRFTWLTWKSESERRILSETLIKLDNFSKTVTASAPLCAFSQACSDGIAYKNVLWK